MRRLIDGYNLMHARGLMLPRFAEDGLRKARDRFLTELADRLGPFESSVTTVVFDAAEPPGDRPKRLKVKNLTVIFAVGDEDADARIEALIASHSSPKLLTVVSSDLRIRQAAKRRKAATIGSDAFLVELDRKPKKSLIPPITPAKVDSERQSTLSESESQFWLAEFSEVATEPGLQDQLRAADFVPTDDEIARIEREIREEGMAVNPSKPGRKKPPSTG